MIKVNEIESEIMCAVVSLEKIKYYNNAHVSLSGITSLMFHHGCKANSYGDMRKRVWYVMQKLNS